MNGLLFSQTSSISGVINSYAAVTGTNANSVTLASTVGFSVGNKVILIQMKGASIDTTNTSNFGTISFYNNTGNYEMLQISAITGNTVTFTTPLTRAYTVSGIVQLVYVPVYVNVLVTGLLTCAPWNGSTGGVLAFEANGSITLNANIDAKGRGFRGGTKVSGSFASCAGNVNGFKLPTTSMLSGNKGEGIVITQSTFSKGMGALANGGGAGNDVNGGGAGGGNFGLGGQGGNSKCSSSPIALCGGRQGKNCTYSNVANKIFLGGGGGSGHENDGVSTAGEAGGGIIIIRGTTLNGNNNLINADGNDVLTIAGNDGQGGGGAGGTVLLDVCATNSLSISAKGGFGGTDNFGGPDCHGKGGGGAGGVIWTSSSTLAFTSVLTGGNPGIFSNSASQCFNASNGATAGQVGGSLSGLIIPGASVITNSAVINANITTTNVSCYNGTNGSASITPSVVGNYTYLWTPGNFTTTSINNLSAGNYSVTLTLGCISNTLTFSISQPPAITLSINSPTSVCNGQAITLTATGASNYLWFNGTTTASVLVTPSSTTSYSVIGTVGSCTATANTSITVTPSPVISVSTQNAACGLTNGSATISVTPVISTFTWNNGSNASVGTGLAAGIYTVIANNNSCLSSSSFTISANAPPVIQTLNATNTSCGLVNGSASISITPLNSSINWGAASTSTTTSINGIAPGSYTISVTSGACQTFSAFTVQTSTPLLINTSSITPSDCSTNTGAIFVSTNLPNSSYTWNNSSTFTTNPHTNLAAGFYSLNIINGACSLFTVFTVPQANNPNSLSSIIASDTCQFKKGSITITNIVGGTPPYAYALNTNSYTSQTNFTNLAAGTYTIFVKDSKNCITAFPSVVSIINGPSNIAYTASDELCGSKNASITLGNVTGGTAPYLYSIDAQNFNTLTTFTNLSAGIYNVVIKDANNCLISKTINIAQTKLTLSITSEAKAPSCTNDDGKLKIINITGGSFPYSIALNQTNYSSQSIIDSLASGYYPIQISDKNNCTNNFMVLVPDTEEEPTLFIPNAFSPNANGVNDGWGAKGYCIKNFNCIIYNRWGEKIAELNDIEATWDGTYKNQEVPNDIYVYLITVKTNARKTLLKSGHIQLIR